MSRLDRFKHTASPSPHASLGPGVNASGQGAVAAGRDIGQAITGAGAIGVHFEQTVTLPKEAFTPAASVACPPGLTNVLKPPRPFIGRDREVALLDHAVLNPGAAAVQAVHGLGGIGKSSLAAHWAVTRAAEYSPAWWVTADSPASIDAGLALLATALQPALAQVLSQEALRERALQWLAAHDGWLLVLDNVADPSDIEPLLARVATGRILITSRRATGWHGVAAPVALDVLSHAEAVELFTEILTHGPPHDADGTDEVCAALGYLPLAVEQAAAFCAETGTSPHAYLDLLARYPADLYASAAEGGDSSRTMARIWHLSLDRMADEPITGQILRTLAWYAPDAIPRSLLASLASAPTLLRALGRLAAHSMLTLHSETNDLTVHRLVQAVARTPDPSDPHRQPADIADACIRATAALAQALPAGHAEDPVSWPIWRALLPHVDSLAGCLPHDSETADTARLLNRMGQFLLREGSITRSLAYIQRSLASLERTVGAEHHDTLAARNNLAQAYLLAGDPKRAAPLFEQLLADSVRLLGEDHPDTLTARNSLAQAYQSVGNPKRAIPMLERTLTDSVRVSGKDHPSTLTAQSSLAGAHILAGSLRQAIQMFEQALTDSLRILGEDHLGTFSIRNNLAATFHAAGDVKRATQLYEESLSIGIRVLGKDHPGTLTSRNNLAYAYVSAGEIKRAFPLYERTLTDSIRVHGEEHPSTLTTRNNIATAYRLAGDLERAIRMYEQTLAVYARISDEDHPDALTVRSNLATTYRQAGYSGRAISLCERTLADGIRVQGEEHPHTLIKRNNLATAYRQAGNLERAIPLYEKGVTDCLRILGEEHHETLTAQDNLASAYASAGNPEQAIPLHKKAVTGWVRILGEDHLSTLTAHNNLAYAYRLEGDLGQAILIYKRTLTNCLRILGKSHPITQTVQGNLDSARRQRIRNRVTRAKRTARRKKG
ncbi:MULTISPECIES: tetratricopeptide repeat protein [unclassified Streptomyces]|uniref:tetratricopeptide repeat protein n=1 Tax=unclassified Streptomyces TaxID=2593676 RepID=UPI00380DE7A1